LIGLATVIAISVIGGGVLYVLNSYWYTRTAVSELDGLKLGDTEADLLFKRSNYSQKCLTRPIGSIRYEYDDNDSRKYSGVELIGGVIQRLYVANEWGYNIPSHSIPIYEGDDEDALRKKWGKEDFLMTQSNNSAIRTYVYRRYNLAVVLDSNRALAVVVFNPDHFYKDASFPADQKDECFDKDGKPKN